MGILKFALIGAAVAYGITQITKKREDGTSILDDLTENAPEWIEKAKEFAADAINKAAGHVKENPLYDNQFDQTL